MSAHLVTKNLAGGHAHRTLFEALDLDAFERFLESEPEELSP